MLIITAADTVGGVGGIPQSSYEVGQGPAPVNGVSANVYMRVLMSMPGALTESLKAAPAAMTTVLQQNPQLMSNDQTVMQRLPQVLATNGTIMAVLPQAMFSDAQTMAAWEKDTAFIVAMLQNDAFMNAVNSNPTVRNAVAQMQAESARASQPANPYTPAY